MAELKEEAKIKVYIENTGRGKVSFADSLIDVKEFPAWKEGNRAIGIYATPVEMPGSHFKAFKGMIDTYHKNQLNIISDEQYRAIVNGEAGPEPEGDEGGGKTDEEEEPEPEPADLSPSQESENQEPADSQEEAGTDQGSKDQRAFEDAKKKGSKNALKKFMKNYPESQFVAEAQKLLEDK